MKPSFFVKVDARESERSSAFTCTEKAIGCLPNNGVITANLIPIFMIAFRFYTIPLEVDLVVFEATLFLVPFFSDKVFK